MFRFERNAKNRKHWCNWLQLYMILIVSLGFSLQTSAFSAFGIGQALVAAGYVLYSCSTELVFTLGRPAGCREFEIHGGRIKAQTKFLETQITQNAQKEDGKMKIRQHWLVLRKRFLCSIAIVPSCCQAFLNHYNLL